MSSHRIFQSFGVLVLAVTTISAAEPIPDRRPVEVVAVEGFDELTVRLDGGEVRRAFLVGLRPIPPEVGFRPLGKEHVEDERTRIAKEVMKHLANADLFARVVTEHEGKLGLSIDAFSHKRHAFPHPWDPRKYPYCNTGWGAYNFNLYFLDQGYTTFLDNIGDNEVADVFHEARRMIESNLSKSIVTIHAVEPRQNVHVVFYDDAFLFLARNHGDHPRPAGNTEPGFFVHSKAHDRWIEIHKISTRDGKFGTSRSDDSEAQKKLAKISVAWDFTAYRDKPLIEMPLRTSGSILFPDRIEYEAKSQRYKLRFFSKLKIESAETALYIPRTDLFAAFGKDPSARIDDAVVPADPPKASSVDRMRTNAMAHAAAIKSLAFSFTVQRRDGWRCEGQFFGEEDRFCVNRRDVVGMRFGDSRLPLQISASAFNGKRHQHRDDVATRLRLKDGSEDASYSLSTPQIFAYQWLQQPGVVFRWDMVRDEATWRSAFSKATYLGEERQQGRLVETVEFAQAEGVPTPCVYRVVFDCDLGYFPIKYTRRVKNSGKISTTMEVLRYKTVNLDSRSVTVPLELRYVENGADGVSFNQKLTLTVDEKSLRINEPIDGQLFTLNRDGISNIYDVDEENRWLALARSRRDVEKLIASAFQGTGDAQERFTEAQSNAGLAIQPVLVLFGQPAAPGVRQLFEDHELWEAINAYRFIAVRTDGDQSMETRRLAKSLQAGEVSETELVLAIADEHGKGIAVANAQELMGDGKLDKNRTLAFLAKHLPAPLDAEQLLKAAMLRATTEGKRVFVQETTPGCPPCWKLTRFLSAHRRELERDFVWVQLDYRWHGINGVLARLRDREEHGVPWYAILDAEGKVLISSVDGEGHNIGYPATPKDRGYFRQMLERTATHLTKEDIAALTDALE